MLTHSPELWGLKLLGVAQLGELLEQTGLCNWYQLPSFLIDWLWRCGLLKADLVIDLRGNPADRLSAPCDSESIRALWYQVNRRATRSLRGARVGGYDKPRGPAPQFHPYRLLVLAALLSEYRVLQQSYPGSGAKRGSVRHLAELLSASEIQEKARHLNDIASLAIVAEPVCYPYIFGVLSWQPVAGEVEVTDLRSKVKNIKYEDHGQMMRLEALESYRRELSSWWSSYYTVDECIQYWDEVLNLVEGVEPNRPIHTIIQLMNAQARKLLKGRLSLVSYLLAIARTLRMGTEWAFDVSLPEEHELKYGRGSASLAKQGLSLYGGRLLEGNAAQGREFLRRLGLVFGTYLRWYVEGTTEEMLLRELLGPSLHAGITLINLGGSTSSFSQELSQDQANGVYSFGSFDDDGILEVTQLREREICQWKPNSTGELSKLPDRVKRGEFVGRFYTASPDVEMHNFLPQELAEALTLWAWVDVVVGVRALMKLEDLRVLHMVNVMRQLRTESDNQSLVRNLQTLAVTVRQDTMATLSNEAANSGELVSTEDIPQLYHDLTAKVLGWLEETGRCNKQFWAYVHAESPMLIQADKGAIWGRLLGHYALNFPRTLTGQTRDIVEAVRAARQMRRTDYYRYKQAKASAQSSSGTLGLWRARLQEHK